MEVHDLAEFIENIIINNKDKIDALYIANGGFEGWFQCELYYALVSSGEYTSVQREIPYDDGTFVDLCVDGMFIELKVDSAHRTGTDMVEGFFSDIEKISGQGFAVLITKNNYSGDIPKEENYSNLQTDYNVFIGWE